MTSRPFKNILVVSLTNIGDVVLTLPVVNILRGNFPEADVSMVIGPHAHELLDGTQGLKEIIVYDKRGSLREKLAFVRTLRSRRFDLVIDLRNTAIPFLLMPVRCNLTDVFRKRWQGSMKAKHIAQLDFLHLDHAKQLKVPLYSGSDLDSLIRKTNERGIHFDEVKKAVVMAPSARTHFKTWPKEKFIELCGMISRDFPVRKILLVGSRTEETVANEIQCHLPYSIVSLAGAITLREYAALVDHAALLIAHDSAAMHIGNYQSTQLIALFGPTNSAQYGENSATSTVMKRSDLACIPCSGVTCDIDRECLAGLSARVVFDEVVKKLQV
jgi:ADP-heptose:LPS heptosyltransferase